ncbi:MAG: HK97 gp10 family phage protein [Clostridium sp.]|uniref:HK97 gp10 family phage protein n=1 Tax=Clostridium sp. TaxID=1506 RepID=UPI00290C5031|nr:HK97 gp10 family phage protein [Clostridium sp.]MDU7337944.1 HK97 gp10 family phage protein [Clostridium sp.]
MSSPFEDEINRVMKAGLQGMQESMFMIEADTKQLCPVDTGTLKRSYTSDAVIDGDNIIGTVGTNVEYAPFVDWKKPHLTAAVDQNMESVKQKIANALRQRDSL